MTAATYPAAMIRSVRRAVSRAVALAERLRGFAKATRTKSVGATVTPVDLWFSVSIRRVFLATLP
jgi:hypothetical protein